MDFHPDPELTAFRQEVRAFLATHPPRAFPVDGMDAGYGSGAVSRAFLRALGARGWLSLCWPREWGGQARPMGFKLVLLEELALAGAPFGPLAGCDQTAESIIRYGSPRLRRELLPRIAAGDATFWQGFSEPGAGSDLLALETQATRNGDHWVLQGHKIWSSHAGIADFGLVLARTDPAARRARGLSMFVVDNRTPGVDIRPIRSLAGPVYHYEVFLDGVRVPADDLLGREGEGFAQLLHGLDTDRFWGRFYKAPMLRRYLDLLIRHARETTRDGAPLARDPRVRQRLASLATEIETLRLLLHRVGWLLEQGQPATTLSCAAKLVADETGQRLMTVATELLGPHALLTADAARTGHPPLAGEIAHQLLVATGHTIAGGTSEIMRNTVAERGLGLPADPR